MGKVIKDRTILKRVGKKYGLAFDLDHGYYIGDAYKNNRGEFLSTFESDMVVSNGRYCLEYFDGCFHPFLVRKDEDSVSIFDDLDSETGMWR